VFDPAVYYGDREADLAMTELFGGFPREFYEVYNDVFPLPDGYARRKHLYNLYHLLNHLNLFGRSYLGQVEETLGLLRGA
jgi:fructosamine-3-kinase